MSITLTNAQNALVGYVMGFSEISLFQSLNYWKNAKQQRLPMSWHPRVLYRGYLPSALNMGSATMMQCAIAGKVKQALTKGEVRALTSGEHLLAGGVGGAMSAPLIGTPLELLMTQQQRKGGPLLSHVRTLIGRNLFRGTCATTVREGVWAMCYLSLPSILRPRLQQSFPRLFPNDTLAMIPTSLLAALVACGITQPFDTVKTCMQGDVERRTFTTFFQTFYKLYAETGMSAFYRGVGYRYSRMIGGIFFMDKLRMSLTRRMEEISV